MRLRLGLAAIVSLGLIQPAFAQQRPLVTEDPETIGAGRILLEGGIDFDHDEQYPVTGLKGNLWRAPTVGISFGLSSIAELQIDGGLYNHLAIASRNPLAPLASQVTATGSSTSDVEDFVIATKIRIFSETGHRPAFGMRFATKLPNASNESGLGTDTTDFLASILAAKTVQSRALTSQAELVGELNGRASTRSGGPLPGTESRGLMKFGGRYTRGTIRFDAAMLFGLTTVDPTVGFTLGFTYVFNAFRVP
jgi:hypothetical protein